MTSTGNGTGTGIGMYELNVSFGIVKFCPKLFCEKNVFLLFANELKGNLIVIEPGDDEFSK